MSCRPASGLSPGAGCGRLSHLRNESSLMAKFNPITFMQEVRQEVAKVTWPTWKEVWITTLMVLIMVALASIFFLLVDQALSFIVRFVLGLGS
jgi:preprotein translocase subunit SecE